MAGPFPFRKVALWASICISTPSFALVLKSGVIKSSADGICMYDLPAKYNVGLLNKTWNMPAPVPHEIPNVSPPFAGIYDTDQFSLDRVFYDRMVQEATFKRRPEDCKLFYVPYFALWETCHKQWLNPVRPELDNEVIGQLKYLGKFRKPVGVDHFITLSRVEADWAIFQNPWYTHMKKLTIEARFWGGHPNVHAIPYPAWFRYNPTLDTKLDPYQTLPTIQVTSATFDVQAPCKSQTMAAAPALGKVCEGKAWCAFQIPNKFGGCAIKAMHGQYKCSGNDKQPVAFHKYINYNPAVVLGCSRGPCWLWGDCHKRVGKERTGPLAVFIGSAKQRERDRNIIVSQCKQRPGVCAVMDTSQSHGINRLRNSVLPSNAILEMNEMLNSAIFCINPPGDTPTRKGLFDSLLAGCIPVITDDDSLDMYTWHLKNYKDVSVVVNPQDMRWGKIHAIDFLASMSEAEIRRKQDAIRQLAFSLQYSAAPSKDRHSRPDAFDVAMINMLKEEKSEYDSFANVQPMSGRLLRSIRNSTAHQ